MKYRKAARLFLMPVCFYALLSVLVPVFFPGGAKIKIWIPPLTIRNAFSFNNPNDRNNYFKQAYFLYRSKNYEKSVRLFWLYTLKGKLLDDYALYYQGLCFIKLRDYHKANYVLHKLNRYYPGFIFHKNAVFYLALSLYKSGYFNSSLINFKYLLKSKVAGYVKAYSLYSAAKIYLRKKNFRSAKVYLIRLYDDFPHFSHIHRIAALLRKIPDFHGKTSFTGREKLKRAINLYYGSSYKKSYRLLTGMNSYEARLVSLKDLIGMKSPLFMRYFNNLRRFKRGGTGKNSGRLSYLKYLKADYYYTMHKPGKAAALLYSIMHKKMYLNKNQSRLFRKIVWSKTLNDIKIRNFTGAEKNLKSLIMVSAGSRELAKYLFWNGMMLRKLGKITDAVFYFNLCRASYPLSYYAVMSKKELRDPLKFGGSNSHSLKLRNVSNVKYKPPVLETGIRNSRDFKQMQRFLAMGIFDLARLKLQGILKKIKTSGNLLEIIKILDGYGDYRDSVETCAALAGRKGAGLKYLKILYPRPYFSSVIKYANIYGLPVNLIYAVMRQESLFNPASYSSAGAIGLMQIISPTGYTIARSIGFRYFNPAYLHKNTINIRFGSYYLRNLLYEFNGRKYLAVASYNAGPNVVSYWKKNILRGEDRLLFIETIPYNQTRNYVKMVLRNYYVYNAIY